MTALGRKTQNRRILISKCQSTYDCLEALGLNRSLTGVKKNKQFGEKPCGSFWRQHQDKLIRLYEDAKRNYNRLIKCAHPDKGGSHDNMVVLNLAMSTLTRRFRNHGLIE